MDEQPEEKVFLDDGRVMVTNTRFIVSRNHIFAMSGVTSIKISKEYPSRKSPILTILFGTVFLCVGIWLWHYYIFYNISYLWYILVIAAIIIASGYGWYHARRPVFHVVLTSASSETKAWADNNRKRIEKVIQALNDSIVYRG